MSIYSNWRRSRRTSRSQLGHLKLAAFEDDGALVVQIFEARGLMRKENAPLDVYVKLYLLPDPHKESKEKTIIVRQKDPTFNTKFTFLHDQYQYHEKNLFIAIWTKNSIRSRNEIIGCMTFKVSELLGPNKGLNGWYQLLDSTKGRNENVRVASITSKYGGSSHDSSEHPKQKTFAVTLLRSEQGYGFNVDGHNPVHIAYIMKDLPAHQADIRKGDVIVEIEGTDVTRADRNLVISIVKKCPEMLHLILRRDPNPVQITNYTSQTLGRNKKRRKTSGSVQPFNGPRSQSYFSIPQSQPDFNAASIYSSQTLMPEYHQFPHSRRHSAQPGLNVLSQPISSYDEVPESERGGQPFPPYKHQRERSTHSGSYSNSRDRIPEESGMGNEDGESEKQLPSFSGQSRLIGSNLSLSSRSRRQNSQSQRSLTADGSEEHLRQESAIEVIGPSNPSITFTNSSSALAMGRYSMTQPTDDGGIYRGGEVGGSVRYPISSRHNTMIGPTNTITAGGYFGSGAATQLESGREMYFEGAEDQMGWAGGGSRFQRSASLSPRHNMIAPPGVHNRFVPTTIVGGAPSGTMSYRGNSRSQTLFSGESGMNWSEEQHVAMAAAGQSTVSRVSEEGLPVEWESLGALEQKRQTAMHNLVRAELSFCNELKIGIECYVEPLRYILTEKSHQKMFTGLEEMYEITKDICVQLQQRQVACTAKTFPFYLSSVADIYWDKLEMLVKYMDVYIKNTTGARQEIALSYTNEEFNRHMQQIDSKRLNIYSFLNVSNEYLPQLTRAMMALTYFTPLNHEDQKHLYNIVQALIKICHEKTLVQTWEQDQAKMTSLARRIGFGKVRPFPVNIPGRVLLVEGDVILIEKRKKRKIWLLMFSDIVLLTSKQGKILATIEEPVPLENLMVQDINCTDAAEFQLSTEDGTLNRLIRASSVSEKENWMQKLKERATGSLTNRRRASVQPHIGPQTRFNQGILRRQLQLASTVATNDDSESTTLSELTAIHNKGDATTNNAANGSKSNLTQEGPLSQGTDNGTDVEGDNYTVRRGSSRRRSLFNVGAKKEAGEKGKDSKKRGGKQAAATRRRTVSVEQLKEWETSFDKLLQSSDGVEMFEEFLRTEFNDENILFWKACERFKTIPEDNFEKEADAIFEEYLVRDAPKLVNLEHQTIKEIEENRKHPERSMFAKAQHDIYLLMARDPFVRFIKSPLFQSALTR